MNSKHQSLVMVVGTDFMASYLPSTSDPAVASQLSAKYTSESDSNGATESSQLLTIQITAGTKDISYAMKQILLGDQAYLQGNSGVWYVLDASALNDSSNNPFAIGTNSLTDPGSMGLDALTGTLTDHKIEVLNGKKLRHITSTLNKDQVINEMGSSDTPFVHSVTGANVDIWIDEATKYLYKIDYKVLTDASAPVVAGQPQGFEVIANFSNFNKLVNFTVPTNPQPATNVKQVLQ
ncbi:hypothetical protein [Tengunoibacter tsumagoiensis]|uniref:Lipoprotein n=1 Tax=Tengunoibacter tsumagoiensis TaxID=2014871 RepID=A0A402A4N7_9CHLR|nr:hypothetical protein [Tengunoibacter tsumagoiensis]GCE14072.1 hypothetical protein KTT_39310 [Tengunoibacter tsumagoiensis]